MTESPSTTTGSNRPKSRSNCCSRRRSRPCSRCGDAGREGGKLHDPEWRDGALHFRYDGADDIRRTTTVHFQPPPDETEKTTARDRLDLGARESKRIEIAVVLSETPENKDSSPKQPAFDFYPVEAGLRDSCKKWVEARTDITTSSRSLNRVLERSLHDLRMCAPESTAMISMPRASRGT